MSGQKPRSFEMSLAIDAPVAAVWAALTEARELSRWFANRVEADPRVGGRYTLSWDGQWEWSTVVGALEPERRLQLVDREGRPYDASGQPLKDVAPIEIAMDFTLHADRGRTILRLVHSGFGSGGAWDDEVDGITLGWNKELRGLRHYLEHHRGQDRHMAWATLNVDGSTDQVWARLTAEGGLITRGASAWAHGGDRAELTLSTGDTITGEVLWAWPNRCLAVTAEPYDNGLFRVSVDRAAGRTMVFAVLDAWGAGHAAEVAAFRDRLKEAVTQAVAQSV